MGAEGQPRPPERLVLSVLVLNWNGRRFLRECLDSLWAQRAHAAEVIVVDNGSSDGSVECVRAHYPWVRVVALGTNAGFPRGMNAGLRAARGEAILLLNNDTKLAPDCLQELGRALRAHPEAGMVAPKVLQAQAPGRIDTAGCSFLIDGEPSGRGTGQPADSPTYASPAWVFGPSAGAGLYRRALLQEVGLFDPGFSPIYHEDQDLNLRAQAGGHRCLYWPRAVVWHAGSGTMGQMSAAQIRLRARNHLFLLAKGLPGLLWLRHLPDLARGQVRAALFYVSRGRGRALVSGKWAALAGLGRVLRQRARLQARRRVPLSYLEPLLERAPPADSSQVPAVAPSWPEPVGPAPSSARTGQTVLIKLCPRELFCQAVQGLRSQAGEAGLLCVVPAPEASCLAGAAEVIGVHARGRQGRARAFLDLVRALRAARPRLAVLVSEQDDLRAETLTAHLLVPLAGIQAKRMWTRAGPGPLVRGLPLWVEDAAYGAERAWLTAAALGSSLLALACFLLGVLWHDLLLARAGLREHAGA